jgi:hypothetical protein
VEENPQTDDDDVLVPEEETKPRTTGLFCFADSDRACGPDCTAYITYPKRASSSELGPQQDHCILISSFERLGRSVTAIASMQAASLKKQKIAEADRQRQSQLDQDPIKASQRSPFPGRET